MARMIRVMSISHKTGGDGRVLKLLRTHLHPGLDLVLLPETCVGESAGPVSLDAEIVRQVRALSKQYRVNLVFPLYTCGAHGERINSALVINREGEIAGQYRKTYPYWSEFDLTPPCAVTPPGDCVVALDFGRLGLAVCFDANFPAVWQRLADEGAELVAWCSAYSAGSQLTAHALNHHYAIVTCTLVPDCAVIDIDGREVFYRAGGDVCVCENVLDLDRCIFHENYNDEKVVRLVAEHPAEVEIEKRLPREQWFLLHSVRTESSARMLSRAYGMTELRDYKKQSRDQIDQMRTGGSR